MTLQQGFDTTEALSAATLGDALAIRAGQWAARGAWLGQLAPFDQQGAHSAWLAGNAEVLAHWGQTGRGGLTDDAAAMNAPNPSTVRAA